jgi:hypothetical protein
MEKMTITEIVEGSMNDRKFKRQVVASCEMNADPEFSCSDYKIDEELFKKFIKKCGRDEDLMTIFIETAHLLFNQENVTDSVFDLLVRKIRKSKYGIIAIALCHADLKESQKAYLHTLPFLSEPDFD